MGFVIAVQMEPDFQKKKEKNENGVPAFGQLSLDSITLSISILNMYLKFI